MSSKFVTLFLSCITTMAAADAEISKSASSNGLPQAKDNSYFYIPVTKGISRFRIEVPYISAENQAVPPDANELFYLSNIYDDGLHLTTKRDHFEVEIVEKSSSFIYHYNLNELVALEMGIFNADTNAGLLSAVEFRKAVGPLTLSTLRLGMLPAKTLIGEASLVSLSTDGKYENYGIITTGKDDVNSTVSIGRRWFPKMFPLEIAAGLELTGNTTSPTLIGEHQGDNIRAQIGLKENLDTGELLMFFGVQLEEIEPIRFTFRVASDEIPALTVPSLRAIRLDSMYKFWKDAFR